MIDDLRPEPTTQDLVDEIDRLRTKVLGQNAVLGAALALLTAVHRAGGYHVFDPAHQAPVQAGMRALEAAVDAALNGGEGAARAR